MSAAAELARWQAVHVYFHDHLDRLIDGGVRPLVAELASQGVIDRFFFIRYGLGGPHLRLRLRLTAGRGDDDMDRVVARLRDDCARSPSRAVLPAPQVRAMHEAALSDEPDPDDTPIQPDNTVCRARFQPEVERYGGPACLPLALDYFTLSSSAGLQLVHQHQQAARGRQLTGFLQVWLREAWSFAGDVDDLRELLGFAIERAGAAMATIVERADQQFAQRPEAFVQVLRNQLETPGPSGAQALASALARIPREARLRALSSQIHMSANRLGATNMEEVYVSRLLCRAAEACGRDALAAALARRPRIDPASAATELARLASAAVERLTGSRAA